MFGLNADDHIVGLGISLIASSILDYKASLLSLFMYNKVMVGITHEGLHSLLYRPLPDDFDDHSRRSRPEDRDRGRSDMASSGPPSYSSYPQR